MRILVFGTGFIYQQNKYRLKNFELIGFLDNDKNKQGSFLDGVIVDCPNNCNKYHYDAIILMSTHYKEMRIQLLNLGVSNEKIIGEDEIGLFNKYIIKKEYCVRNRDINKKRILLVSNELTNTGAPNALKNVANCLIKHDFQVDILTCKEGELLYDFVCAGVNVILYNHENMISEDIFLDYNLVFFNTIVVKNLVKRFVGNNIPALWWIHEDEEAFLKFGINKDDILIDTNIIPLAVSNRVAKAYCKYTGEDNIYILSCGVKEKKIKNTNFNKNRIVCAIIGYVNEVKGQDLLLSALKLKEKYWENELEFWIIGTITEKDKLEFEKHKCIKVFGCLGHDRLMQLYKYIDIVLCTSRYESLSLSIIEGMMNKKICVVSSNTGIAEYCISKYNSVVFQSENIDSMIEAIDWLLDNKDLWEIISNRGYEVYRNNFTMEAFENSLMKLIDRYV